MQINFEQLKSKVQEYANKEIHQPAQWQALIDALNGCKVTVDEYLIWAFTIKGLQTFVNMLGSPNMVVEFISYRTVKCKKATDKIEWLSEQVEARISQKWEFYDIIEDSFLDGYCAYRYVLSSILNNDTLKNKYLEGAVYEFKALPCLYQLLKDEYSSEYLPNKELEGGHHGSTI